MKRLKSLKKRLYTVLRQNSTLDVEEEVYVRQDLLNKQLDKFLQS